MAKCSSSRSSGRSIEHLAASLRGKFISQAAENIVRRKRGLERFDRESQNLLGQDDIFGEQLTRLAREQRYLGQKKSETS